MPAKISLMLSREYLNPVLFQGSPHPILHFSNDTPKSAQSAMVDILAQLVDESQSVPQEVVDILLAQFLPKNAVSGFSSQNANNPYRGIISENEASGLLSGG